MAISLILIVVIFSIYNDLYEIFLVSYPQKLYLLLIAKWFLVFLIVGINCYISLKIQKTVSSSNSKYNFTKSKKDKTIIMPPIGNSTQHKEILSKKKLKTKTDIILQKYMAKKDD